MEAASKEAERGGDCSSLRDQTSRRPGAGERGAEKIVSNHSYHEKEEKDEDKEEVEKDEEDKKISGMLRKS